MLRIKCADEFSELRAVIKVIGLGGAGGNAINRMVEAGVRDVDLIAANTDAQVLRRSKAPLRIQIGEAVTKGLGVGGDPARGRLAALESKEQVRESLSGADLVFITAGMGGGTGTGAAPVVAELAKQANALTIGVVSRPFEFEGRIRAALAEEGIRELRGRVDTLLIIPNDSVFAVIDETTPSAEAFRKADDVLRQAIQSITDVITIPGEINVDLNDIKAIMADAGEAHMGIGEGTGPHRAMEAAKQAVHSTLLENVSIEGSKGMLVNFISDRKTLTHSEIKQAMEFISRKVSPEAKIKYGQAYDDSLGDRLRVTVIATGFPPRRSRALPKDFLVPAGASLAESARRGGPPPAGFHPGRPESGVRQDWDRPAFTHWKLKKLV